MPLIRSLVFQQKPRPTSPAESALTRPLLSGNVTTSHKNQSVRKLLSQAAQSAPVFPVRNAISGDGLLWAAHFGAAEAFFFGRNTPATAPHSANARLSAFCVGFGGGYPLRIGVRELTVVRRTASALSRVFNPRSLALRFLNRRRAAILAPIRRVNSLP